MEKYKPTILFLIICIINACSPRTETPPVLKADVIIYGGTSSSVIAAVEVVQSGKSVIMISPDKHLGGLTSGGLGYTDTGDKSAAVAACLLIDKNIAVQDLNYNELEDELINRKQILTKK